MGTAWWRGDAVGLNLNGSACGIVGTNNYVRSIQYILVADHDFATTSWSQATGVWNSATLAALKRFQSKRNASGLSADGCAGINTWKKMESYLRTINVCYNINGNGAQVRHYLLKPSATYPETLDYYGWFDFYNGNGAEYWTYWRREDFSMNTVDHSLGGAGWPGC